MARYLATRDFAYTDGKPAHDTQDVLIMKAGEELDIPDHLYAKVAATESGALMPLFDGTPQPKAMTRENKVRRYIATRYVGLVLTDRNLELDLDPGDEVDLADDDAAEIARVEPGALYPRHTGVTTETVHKADTEGVFINTGEIDRTGYKATRSG